jgi:two-component system NarL family sensor kinase
VTVLGDSAAEVRESIGALRSLLVEIYPPNLFDEGLELALADLAARVTGRGVTVSVDASTATNLPRAVAALMYRAAQEALRNVVSHSQASTASVTVRSDGHIAVLEVGDNGIGFDADVVSQAPKTGHFGLHALTQLVHDAGGRLDLDTMPGGGTRLRVEVPLQ